MLTDEDGHPSSRWDGVEMGQRTRRRRRGADCVHMVQQHVTPHHTHTVPRSMDVTRYWPPKFTTLFWAPAFVSTASISTVIGFAASKDQSVQTGSPGSQFRSNQPQRIIQEMACPLWPPISLLQILKPLHAPGKVKFTEIFKPLKATLSVNKTLWHFLPLQDSESHKSRAGRCQWPPPQPQWGGARRTPGTVTKRKPTPSDKALLRLTWTKKACSLAPHPQLPRPPAPGALLALETDERPCVSWPFICGKKTRKKGSRSAFLNLMEDQGCVPLPHCCGGSQQPLPQLCNAWSPQRPSP